MTPELNVPLTEALATYVSGDFVYFLLPGCLVKYSITYNIFPEIVKLSENMTQLQIFEDTYFYWRQYARSDFYIPLNSYLYMDAIDPQVPNETLSLLKKRSMKLDLSIFQGSSPHLSEINFDV